MRRAKLRVFEQKKNMTKDASNKITKYVQTRYSVALVPKLTPGPLAVRSTRVMGKRMTKAMLSWGLYSDRTRMIDRASRNEAHTHIETKEPWTTRTCSVCGTVRPKFSGETFVCVDPKCATTLDRDYNAAINIFIRYTQSTP